MLISPDLRLSFFNTSGVTSFFSLEIKNMITILSVNSKLKFDKCLTRNKNLGGSRSSKIGKPNRLLLLFVFYKVEPLIQVLCHYPIVFRTRVITFFITLGICPDI